MPGPMPKDPAIRQRRNKTATRATLSIAADPERPIPELLPARRRWHVLTRAWWADLWQSPMAAEYLQADIHGLYILALLVDRFWKKPSTMLSTEIRLQRQCFGLTPIDRRRLQWEVQKVEDATSRKRQPQRPVIPEGEDPRNYLSVV